MNTNSNRSLRPVIGMLAILFFLAFSVTPQVKAQGMSKGQKMQMMKKLKAMAPARGYLEAHNKAPQALLGGPIHIKVSQETGGVFVALPDKRKLDERVFGTPKMPRAFAGTPGINGLPPMARAVEDGHYTTMTQPSPFGDKYTVMADGKLMIDATDATATDAATTEDKVQMKATWKDKAGNTYEVRCCKMMAAHGLEFPTFGGVVTNHLLHGFTRLGTALMPTEFTYFGFWGMGAVLKNGKVLDQPRLIHGMLTEYVRKEGYALDEDNEVTPTRKQFHLMVTPFAPNMETHSFDKKPVNTGLTLPNGMKLPFWHVMFENLEIDGTRSK